MVSKRIALLLLLFCLLVAASLRIPGLETTPPGVHFDEAANGILASEIAFQGERPIFISSYTGKEVLFFYLTAAVMRGIGDSPLALRLTAVYISLLTMSAIYWLGVELTRNRRVALIAAALIAISFWHLLFSRLGFRAISQPLLQTLMLAAWLRGLRTDQWRWFGLSGLFLGLAGYTYLAVRLFPVLLLLAAVPGLVKRPFSTTLANWRRHLLLGSVALIVLLPLIVYFGQNPDAFWVRITQVSPGNDSGLTLGEAYRRSLQMIFLVGDPYIRFNLPGKPLFNWFWGGLLCAGWLITLANWRRASEDWQKTAVLLLLLTPFIMVLPTALATNEILPSNLRAIGLIPLIFYLPAVGLVWLLEQRPFSRLAARWLFTTGAILLIGGTITGWTYFRTWGTQAALFYETDADLAALANALDQLPLEGETLYVASPHYQHPTVALLSERYEQIKWLPESQVVPFHTEHAAYYLFPAKSAPPDWASPLWQTVVLVNEIPGPDGAPAVTIYRLASPPAWDPQTVVDANFSNVIRLRGYDLLPQASETAVSLLLYWDVIGDAPGEFMPFVHLEDAWRYRWSQTEPFAYPTAQWERGEQFVQRITVPIQPGTPPGAYTLKVGLFNTATGDRLARLDENGRYAGDAWRINQVPVAPTPATAVNQLPSPAQPINATVAPGLRLLGSDALPTAVSTGDRLPTALWWQSDGPLPTLSVRYELLKAGQPGGRILANRQPVHDTYPFLSWIQPQLIIDRQSLPIPTNLEPGSYTLSARLLNGADDSLYTTTLGTVEVEATERRFRLPETNLTPLDATFGDEIALRGYQLDELASDRYQLTLFWQALTEPTTDYTVFVHLLTAAGTCTPCLWQQDVMPQQNGYPTGRWVTGEVVADTYEIIIPPATTPGLYQLEIGLYIAENGTRLRIETAVANTGDALFLQPIRVKD